MTLQQLEYIIALDKTRHFVRAAEMCGVTQPTLSAMIQKLEDELDCRIFDRSSHPIVPTEVGAMILQQAQVVMFNVQQLKENILSQKGSVAGSLSLAIIPTVAPYLLPELITLFRRDYADISLKITEMRTETIIEKLHNAEMLKLIWRFSLLHSMILRYLKFRCTTKNLWPIFRLTKLCICRTKFPQMICRSIISGCWRKDIVSGIRYSIFVKIRHIQLFTKQEALIL